ncbi:MAG: type IV pilus assembly protein PilM [Candidatus Doudnabacteria bacterium]|nr:type IV pilus assembly protein PilM [Candidatus Doudnabacteria bacterium]
MFFFKKRPSILGVDIGTSDIKIVQLTHTGERPHLDTYGIVNLSYQLNTDDSNAVVAKAADILKQLVEHAGATTKRCVISLPNSAVFTSIIDMPDLSEKDLEKAIQFEAKKYVPLPISEVILSWSVVGRNEAAKTRSILLTAVPKHLQESYLKLFALAGLELEVIEIEALALIRSLIFDTQSNHVIIDIGAKSTGINFIKEGFLQLSRSVNVGGDTITSQIGQVLNISQSRAEQFKKDFGISGGSFIPEAVRPVLETIRNETKQLFTIYQARGVNVGKIVLVGGGSALPGLVEFFAELGVPVELGDPLRSLAYPPAVETVLRRYALHLSVAIGLAMNKE